MASNNIPQYIQEQRKAVVDDIVKALEEEKIPWRANWHQCPAPCNAATGHPYQGINALHLLITAIKERHTDDPRYMTFLQASQQGLCVKKGAHGHRVEFWKEYKTNTPELDKNGDDTLIHCAVGPRVIR